MKHLTQINNNFKYDDIFAHIDSICEDANHCINIRNNPSNNLQNSSRETPENRNLFNYVLNELDVTLMSCFQHLHFFHCYENKTLTKDVCRTIYLIVWLQSSFSYSQFQYNSVKTNNKCKKSKDIDWNNANQALKINNVLEFNKSFKKLNNYFIELDIAIDKFLIDNFLNLSFSSFLNTSNFLKKFNLPEDVMNNLQTKQDYYALSNYYYLTKLIDNKSFQGIFMSLFHRFENQILNDVDLLKEFLMLIPVKLFNSNNIDIETILNEHNNFNEDYDFVEAFRQLNDPFFPLTDEN
jgi:hypothetical protein